MEKNNRTFVERKCGRLTYDIFIASGMPPAFVPGGGLAGRSRMSRWIILELCVVDVCDF